MFKIVDWYLNLNLFSYFTFHIIEKTYTNIYKVSKNINTINSIYSHSNYKIEYTLRITNFKTIIVKHDGTNLKADLVIEVGPFGSLCVAR